MQLEFNWRDPRELHRELEEQTGLRLHLTLTDNRSTMVAVKPGRGPRPTKVRLHHMFLAAGPPVVKALAAWVKGCRAPASAQVLDHFIASHQHVVRRRPRRLILRPVGRRFDLRTFLEELNKEFFEDSITVHITWGRMPSGRRRRSIRFGSFNAEENLIRIHPLLDQAFVPAFFVRYIVFHEMLHAHLGIKETPSGRRAVHTREFRRREQTYPDYDRAVAWQADKANLARLLKKPVSP